MSNPQAWATALDRVCQERDGLKAKLEAAEKEINTKADWIEATINDMAADRQKIEAAEGLAEACKEVAERYSLGDGELNWLIDDAKEALQKWKAALQ